ncbi:hypothetical protein M758_UG238000 [Ceratodon purpureus]|nr:hypothetical protein M758_UG238000 [Ceratodon purpureus]
MRLIVTRCRISRARDTGIFTDTMFLLSPLVNCQSWLYKTGMSYSRVSWRMRRVRRMFTMLWLSSSFFEAVRLVLVRKSCSGLCGEV